jgi:malate dehydrogenase (oxaloacetate-decarboxylating)
MIQSMNEDAIIFVLANPVPEISPDEAKEAGARIVGTGRSDFANVIPKAFDLQVGPRVAAAVAEAAVSSGIARRILTYHEELEQAINLINQKSKRDPI